MVLKVVKISYVCKPLSGAGEEDIVTLHDISDLIKKGCTGVEGEGAGFDRVKSHLEGLLPALQQVGFSS